MRLKILMCINVTVWFRTLSAIRNLLSTLTRYENRTFAFTAKPEADIRALTFLIRSVITPSLSSSCSPSSLIFLTRHHRRSWWISSRYWISKRLLVFEHPQRSIDRFRSLGLLALVACSRFLASNFIPLFCTRFSIPLAVVAVALNRNVGVSPWCCGTATILRWPKFPKVANK